MTAPWVVPVARNAVVIPDYKTVQHGVWQIRRSMHFANTGFWGNEGPAREVAFLEGPSQDGGPAGWMSTLQLEVDSQEIGIAGAVGTTVVLGFGLGWATVNAALNPAVDRVIAVERDEEIIALAEISGVFDGVAPDIQDKIEIRHADAFAFEPDGPVNTLLADIWPDWLDAQVYSDMTALQARIGSERVHFWGQEMAIWRHTRARIGPDAPFDWPAIRAAVAEDMALPLILPDWPEYPEMILNCVRRAAVAEAYSVEGLQAHG